jgi:hypothetical protein
LRQIGGGTIFDGSYEELAWINVVRYPVKPKEELLAAFKEELNTDFGIVRPNRIVLLKNSSRTLVGAEVVHEFVV